MLKDMESKILFIKESIFFFDRCCAVRWSCVKLFNTHRRLQHSQNQTLGYCSEHTKLRYRLESVVSQDGWLVSAMSLIKVYDHEPIFVMKSMICCTICLRSFPLWML
jgi:hypothetical protein